VPGCGKLMVLLADIYIIKFIFYVIKTFLNNMNILYFD
jgi:hypothetical protein